MSPREYCKAVGGGLVLAIFWSVFALVLTGQYRDILPEPARPEYSRMETSAADLAAARIAAGSPTLVKPMSPGTSNAVAQAETPGQRRMAPSLSIFGKSGRQTSIFDAISRSDAPSKQ
ncbi:MAG TPA: hypothetical protein VG269_26930 [Tepidisphaeraceae bacterium]|jgi:hypothetical protein|nr:hypothetical protein [Tepidisphaeraceae bacterium]